MDVISDVDWNTRYNMFVVSGFGQEFPILCYVFARQPEEIDEMLYRYSGKLTSQTAARTDLDDPQNAPLRENVAEVAEHLEQRSAHGRQSVLSDRGPPRQEGRDSFGAGAHSDYNLS